MKRELNLKPLRNAPALFFEYDDETGSLTGRDAATAGEFIGSAEHVRFVVIEPHPCSHEIGSAPHSAADLAAIFGQWYELPDWLETARPYGEPGDDTEQVPQLVY
jgi:hypothetical protein